MVRELAALVRPENAERIVCGQCVAGRTIATSQLDTRHHFDHHRHQPLPPHPPPLHFHSNTAIMSDNENGENGDELVTKPFKFVTGELFPLLRISSIHS
jgi:hypothetical protein